MYVENHEGPFNIDNGIERSFKMYAENIVYK